MLRVQLISLLIGIAFGSGCKSGQDTAMMSPTMKIWELSVFETYDTTWAEDYVPVLILSDSTVSGFSGCNRFFGQVMVNDSSLHFSSVVSTKMACKEEQNRLEVAFQEALTAIERWKIVSNHLILMDAGGSAIMRFKRGEKPEKPE